MTIPEHERRAQLAARDGQLRQLRAKYPDRRIWYQPGTGTWGAGGAGAWPEAVARSPEGLDQLLARQAGQ